MYYYDWSKCVFVFSSSLLCLYPIKSFVCLIKNAALLFVSFRYFSYFPYTFSPFIPFPLLFSIIIIFTIISMHTLCAWNINVVAHCFFSSEAEPQFFFIVSFIKNTVDEQQSNEFSTRIKRPLYIEKRLSDAILRIIAIFLLIWRIFFSIRLSELQKKNMKSKYKCLFIKYCGVVVVAGQFRASHKDTQRKKLT